MVLEAIFVKNNHFYKKSKFMVDFIKNIYYNSSSVESI